MTLRDVHYLSFSRSPLLHETDELQWRHIPEPVPRPSFPLLLLITNSSIIPRSTQERERNRGTEKQRNRATAAMQDKGTKCSEGDGKRDAGREIRRRVKASSVN